VEVTVICRSEVQVRAHVTRYNTARKEGICILCFTSLKKISVYQHYFCHHVSKEYFVLTDKKLGWHINLNSYF